MSAWLDQMFSAETSYRGNIIRRNRSDVEKYASFEELLSMVQNRGWHLIETGEQLVVVCNEGALIIHC